MTDKPMLFSGPMVRAILDGRKTQTRRVITPRNDSARLLFFGDWTDGYVLDPGNAEWRERAHGWRVGDRLYVRETWRASYGTEWFRDELGRAPKPSDMDPATTAVEYLADGTRELGGKIRPGIHMPRWASRITLTVTDVRVQRLQEISDDDALSEGLLEAEDEDGGDILYSGTHWTYPVPYEHLHNYPREAFQALWDSINGERPGCSWEANPWCCAISFSVALANIDSIKTEGSA